MSNRAAESLQSSWACPEAIEWLNKQPSFEVAWQTCERGDWMFWLLGLLSGPPNSSSRKLLAVAASECARLSLPIIPGAGNPLIGIIEMVEVWASSEDSELANIASVIEAKDADGAPANAIVAQSMIAEALLGVVVSDAQQEVAADAARTTARGVRNMKMLREARGDCALIARKHYPNAPSLEGEQNE